LEEATTRERGGRDGEAAMDREEAVLPFPDFTSFTNLPFLSSLDGFHE